MRVIYFYGEGVSEMESNKMAHMVSFVLVIIGALNWGLVGLFGLNLVTSLFGTMPGLEKIVYLLVGAAAVYLLATHSSDCRHCMEMSGKKRK